MFEWNITKKKIKSLSDSDLRNRRNANRFRDVLKACKMVQLQYRTWFCFKTWFNSSDWWKWCTRLSRTNWLPSVSNKLRAKNNSARHQSNRCQCGVGSRVRHMLNKMLPLTTWFDVKWAWLRFTFATSKQHLSLRHVHYTAHNIQSIVQQSMNVWAAKTSSLICHN